MFSQTHVDAIVACLKGCQPHAVILLTGSRESGIPYVIQKIQSFRSDLIIYSHLTVEPEVCLYKILTKEEFIPEHRTLTYPLSPLYYEMKEWILELAGPRESVLLVPQGAPYPVACPAHKKHSTKYTVGLRHEWSVTDAQGMVIATATVNRRLGYLWLFNVWTHPNHRRQGLATQIIQNVLAHYTTEYIFLHVESYRDRPLDEDELEKWYLKLGFETTAVPGVLKYSGNKASEG